MTNLFLEEFKCVVETDEIGWDSPYFVIFIGQPGNMPSSSVYVISKEAWDNEFESGMASGKVNIKVAKGIDHASLVLVALMEEDFNRDVAGQDLDNIRDWMAAVFKAYGGIGGISLETLAGKVKEEFARAINANTANDEVVAIKRLKIVKGSVSLPLIHFYGDGGHYWARFKLA